MTAMTISMAAVAVSMNCFCNSLTDIRSPI